MANNANIFAIVAVAVALGTSAFTPAKTAKAAGDMYWFEVEADGEIGDFLGTNSAGESNLDPSCGIADTQYCGLQLSEEDVDNSNPSDPQPNISNIADEESSLTGPHEVRKKP